MFARGVCAQASDQRTDAGKMGARPGEAESASCGAGVARPSISRHARPARSHCRGIGRDVAHGRCRARLEQGRKGRNREPVKCDGKTKFKDADRDAAANGAANGRRYTSNSTAEAKAAVTAIRRQRQSARLEPSRPLQNQIQRRPTERRVGRYIGKPTPKGNAPAGMPALPT